MIQGTFGKLLRRPQVVVALLVIAGALLVSLLAYVIAPDNSPNANNMIVELGAKRPGFSCQLLKVPKAHIPVHEGIITEWMHGSPSDYVFVPLVSYAIIGDSIAILHYIDDGLHDRMAYPLRQLVPAGQTITTPAGYVARHSIIQRTFYLGTDRYGRDILSRLVIGSRVSLAVGFVAVFLSLAIGTLLGAVAGYFGGRTDNIVMWLINVLWSIPTLLLVFAITLTIGKGFWEIFVAIGLTMWVGAARIIRGQVMVLREMEYISAARALGINDMRIIYRHILPNIAGPLLVVAASNFAAAILTEAGLSFLGIGVQPPQPSWGLMMKEHYNFILAGKPFAALIPGIAIMLLVFSFNILGNALRDALDVKG